jgi:hypothetical protein
MVVPTGFLSTDLDASAHINGNKGSIDRTKRGQEQCSQGAKVVSLLLKLENQYLLKQFVSS